MAIIMFRDVAGFNKVGGLSGLREKWPGDNGFNASNSTCDVGDVPSNAFHMFRSPSDEIFPWPAVVIAIPSTGIFYWCSSQVNIVLLLLLLLLLLRLLLLPPPPPSSPSSSSLLL